MRASRLHGIRSTIARHAVLAIFGVRRRLRDFGRSLTSVMPVSNDDLPRLAARAWVRGRGIEIGALHHPMRLPQGAFVRYVDRLSVAELRRQYPTLAASRFAEVNVVDDAERLAAFASASEDFVIANHFLEHCQDPIGALKNMVRVLRPGGVLFLTLPDKRATFDCDRPVTSLAHLRSDHEHGPHGSRLNHYDEWVRLVEKVIGEEAIQKRIENLLSQDYSIHFHVWTFREMLELFMSLAGELGFEIMSANNRGKEAAFVLRKNIDR